MSINKELQYSFFFQDGATFYRNLKSIGFEFLQNKTGHIIGKFNSMQFYIQSYEEMYILNEIFFEGTYSFTTPSKCILIDIGMNVGFATLFFASLNNVMKIISYEPVLKTYEQGIKNLELNPNSREKIITYNLGVGKHNHFEEFQYSQEWKGSVGVRELSNTKKQSSKKIETVKVQIQDIEDVIKEAKSYCLSIVAKVDCEGAEYDIMRRLDALNELSSIDLFMIEWHDKGPNELTEILHKAGFATIVSRPYMIHDVGIIYAYNGKNQLH